MPTLLLALMTPLIAAQPAGAAPPQGSQSPRPPLSTDSLQQNAPPATTAPLPPIPAPKAGYFTAGDLARLCVGKQPGNVEYCFGYITAVHDSMKAYEIWLGQREFCIPPGAAQADLRRAFISHMDGHPSDTGGQAASVVAVALKTRYPCGQ